MAQAGERAAGYPQSMERRALMALTLCAALILPSPAASESLLGEELGGTVSGAASPAFRAAQGVSDGLYNFMRSHLINAVLPEGLTRSLRRAPQGDSYALFREKFHQNEVRALRRWAAAPPTQDASLATEEQMGVLVDSFQDTMLGRYDLELFGRASGKYAKDRRHWDAGFLTMAAVMGGTFLYLNGLRADASLGSLRLGIDLRAGHTLKRALEKSSDASRVAGLELGYKDHPLTVAAQLGLSRGQPQAETVGLNYRFRY